MGNAGASVLSGVSLSLTPLVMTPLLLLQHLRFLGLDYQPQGCDSNQDPRDLDKDQRVEDAKEDKGAQGR